MGKATVAAGLVLALGAAGCSKPAAPAAKAEEKPAGGAVLKPQETCPVMGGKIDRAICTVHKGKCVYFCCESCVPKFKEAPEKYVKRLETRGVALPDASACERCEGHGEAEKRGAAHHHLKTQATCPVMGGAADKAHYADHDGKRVYFCCESCIGTFRKDPDKYLRALADKGEAPIPAPKDE